MLQKIAVYFLFISFVIPLCAEEENRLLNYYDTEIVTLNYGWGGVTLNYRGNNYGTFFGMDAKIKSTLSSDIDTKSFIYSYSAMNTIGHILLWGGLATFVTGFTMYYFDYYSNFSIFESYSPTSLGQAGLVMGIGGIVSATIGAFLVPGSISNLLKGVNIYNRNKIKEYR